MIPLFALSSKRSSVALKMAEEMSSTSIMAGNLSLVT